MNFWRPFSIIDNFKVKTKVILLLLFTAYLSIFFISSVIYYIGRKTIDTQIRQELTITAENIMESIDRMIYERHNDLQLLITDSVLSDPQATPEQKSKILENSMIKLGWYDNLYLTDPDGMIIAATKKSVLGANVSNASWYQKTQRDFIYVSDVLRSRFTQKKTIVFANQVANADNRLLGTMFAEFSWKVIEDLLKHTIEEIELFLVLGDGSVIAYKGEKPANKIVTLEDIYQSVNCGENIFAAIKSQGYLGFKGFDWQVIVQMPKRIAYAPMTYFTRFIWIAVIIISALLFVVGRQIAKRFVQPILKLTDGVAKIGQGILTEKILVKTKDEIGFLASNFNDMTASLLEKTNNLLAEKGKYKSILESTDAGIILFDKKNYAIAHNRTFCEMFGYRNRNLRGKTAEEIFIFLEDKHIDTSSKTNISKINKIIKNRNFRKQFKMEISLISKFYKIFTIFSQPVETEGGTLLGRIWVFNDITEEREAEKTKNDFISVASHKLRTPLTALNWTIQMFKDKTLGFLSVKQKKVLKQLENQTLNLSSLTKILMAAAEIHKNTITIKKEIFSLEVAISDIYQKISKMISDGEPINLKIPPLAELKRLSVKADKEKIKQVLSILVDNAFIYSKPGEKNNIEISVTKIPGKKKLEICVSDTGIGIPFKEQRNIFRKFFRGKKAITSYTEGTGLSLYLVKIIIDSHKEKIRFESEEGQGAKFYFTLTLGLEKK